MAKREKCLELLLGGKEEYSIILGLGVYNTPKCVSLVLKWIRTNDKVDLIWTNLLEISACACIMGKYLM